MQIEGWQSFVNKSKSMIEKSPGLDEANTKNRIIDPFLRRLGWGPGEVRVEYQIKFGTRIYHVDYALMVEGNPAVFIEAKALRKDLNREHAEQLLSYGDRKRVKWCLLTNGKELRIYNSDWWAPEENPPQDALLEAINIDAFVEKMNLIRKLSKSSVESGETNKVFNQIKQIKDTIQNLRKNRASIESDLKEVFNEYAADSAQKKIDQTTARLVDDLIEELSEYPKTVISKQKSVQEQKEVKAKSGDTESLAERKRKTKKELPELNWAKCKSQQDFMDRVKNISNKITSSYIEIKEIDNGCRLYTGPEDEEIEELEQILLKIEGTHSKYGLKIEAHIGDTMVQSRNLYKNTDFTLEDARKLSEKEWEFEADFTIQHWPKHEHIINFKTKQSKENDYFHFWRDNIDLLEPRDKEELISKLNEFADQDLIVIGEKKDEEIQEKIDESGTYYTCPGVLLSYDFAPEKAAKLDNKRKLEEIIKKRILEVVEMLGKTCDFIDF